MKQKSLRNTLERSKSKDSNTLYIGVIGDSTVYEVTGIDFPVAGTTVIQCKGEKSKVIDRDKLRELKEEFKDFSGCDHGEVAEQYGKLRLVEDLLLEYYGEE